MRRDPTHRGFGISPDETSSENFPGDRLSIAAALDLLTQIAGTFDGKAEFDIMKSDLFRSGGEWSNPTGSSENAKHNGMLSLSNCA